MTTSDSSANPDQKLEIWEKCTREEICEMRANGLTNYKIDWESGRSLDNWVARLGLECEDNH
jgi:hypothetical protein